MVAYVSITLFLDCQVMGIALTEHVKDGSLQFFVTFNIITRRK